MQKKFGVLGLVCGCLFAGCVPAWAAEVTSQVEVSLRQVEQYNFSIHVLAMLLVGFGFLMVFVKKHGYGATAGTYLVVGVGIPLYLLLRSTGAISANAMAPSSIHVLLLAEFACASALIAMGAVLGRLRVYQYALVAALLIPAYMVNEWLVVDGGLGVTKGFVDTAGSIVTLWSSISRPKSPSGISIRLTQQHRREAKGSLAFPTVHIPKPDHLCPGCGKRVRKQQCLECAVTGTREHFNKGREIAQRPEFLFKRFSTPEARTTSFPLSPL